MKKRIIVSVSNDLATDQRVRKQCEELWKAGYDILLLGRLLPGSPYFERPYKTQRVKLPFNKGALFYASLNIYLFFKILFSRADILWANDLDTLPANWLVSLMKGKRLVYDSHEYFTEVPEIQHKPRVKSLWKFFEKKCIRRTDLVITVSPSIADLLKKTYQLDEVLIVRNVPLGSTKLPKATKTDLGLDENRFLLLLQGGGINVNRGGEELVEAMRHIEKADLVIVGGGDAMPELKRISAEFELRDKVCFLPRMPYEAMMRYTSAADLGFSLDKDGNLNYRFSLPNKVFDYAMAGLPMITSDLPEVAAFVRRNEIGVVLTEVTPQKIALQVNMLVENPVELSRLKLNASKMSAELSWENEFAPVLTKIKTNNA
ncbi:glycosyltransferase family 4 protein [Cryomorphaceae bacterium 1068]|nr:glycosyltransferase family 4 protein [Cryomorphaceae bacterium 1068]